MGDEVDPEEVNGGARKRGREGGEAAIPGGTMQKGARKCWQHVQFVELFSKRGERGALACSNVVV